MIYEVYPIYHQEKKDARIEEILSGGTSDGGLECLKQTDQRGLYRYLPSVDNGCAGGLKSQLTKKCQDCPSVGILMVMRLAATILLTEDMSKSSFSLKSHFQIKGILKQKFWTCLLMLFCMFGTLKDAIKLKWFRAPHREKLLFLWRDLGLTPKPSLTFYLHAALWPRQRYSPMLWAAFHSTIILLVYNCVKLGRFCKWYFGKKRRRGEDVRNIGNNGAVKEL